MQGWVSRTFWSTHRDPAVAQEELASRFAALAEGELALNVGSGESDLHRQAINVDLQPSEHSDALCNALALPFADMSFEFVLSQETLEHVANPFLAVKEMERVLKPNGLVYIQVPFILGYHPDPDDYWRFTRTGVQRLIEQAGLECERVVPTFAAATGFNRILVEFLAGLAARLLPRAYLPTKGAMAILFYPLKWLDGWLLHGAQRDRIAGGYFGIGRKAA